MSKNRIRYNYIFLQAFCKEYYLQINDKQIKSKITNLEKI